MTRMDRQILFSALGFMTVLLKEDAKRKDSATRAVSMSKLIEAFCEATLPELSAHQAMRDKTDVLDKWIDLLKEGIENKRETKLPDDPSTRRGVYERLIERHRAYASNEQIANAALYFLNQEVNHAKEANMMIVNVQGADDVFTPYESMATAIAEVLEEKGACAPDDLESRGFSSNDIKRQWPMAYALAKVELNWMES